MLRISLKGLFLTLALLCLALWISSSPVYSLGINDAVSLPGLRVRTEAAEAGTAGLSVSSRDPHGAESGFHRQLLEFFQGGDRDASGLWILLALAFLYGCLHALAPGHAKTVTAVYLVGSRHHWPHAVLLALTVTLTHTGGVLLLAVITRLAVGSSLGLQAQAALSGISGLIVLLLGIQRVRGKMAHAHGDRTHIHESGAAHAHPHPHEGEGHAHERRGSPWEVVWLGFAGGLVPCPGALWIYLLSLGFGRPGLAILLILSLSLGLALVLLTVGLVTLYLRNLGLKDRGVGSFFDRHASLARWKPRLGSASRALPAVAGIILILIGSFMLWRSLLEVGFLDKCGF
jgi:ABC-type nickel/cobalt efflux system permease component RcnA